MLALRRNRAVNDRAPSPDPTSRGETIGYDDFDDNMAPPGSPGRNKRPSPFETGNCSPQPTKRRRFERETAGTDIDNIVLVLRWQDSLADSSLNMFADSEFPGTHRAHHYSYEKLREGIEKTSGIP